ncbi:MAG: hypothetical protein ACREKN_01555 [Longimicrobiaceae bacterium]
MDVITLLFLLFFFVVIPILEGLAKRKRGGGTPLPPGEGEEWEEDQPPVPAEERPREWSEGWGGWPGEEPAPEPEATRWEPGEETVSLETIPEVETVSAEEILDEITYREPETRRPAPPSPSLSSPPPPPLRPAGRPAALAAALDSPHGLRRAVILAEVLGPPRALAPLERDL